ncbi:MAG: prepilin-type N-terminal cleavage/methylation domain-containing protein [Candidatus Sumerlaeia bacterium]|nr:prepilin-type N-terminal cleavage/methylation domain-containing protein [Candidatus Sumerlaeia bacterium]
MIRHRHHERGLTLIELLVVSLIIAILTTIAVVTVTGLTTRARISATFGTIRAMEIAADRYEIDFGEFPLSSTGTQFGAGSTPNPTSPATGNGYFLLTVLHSLSGSAAFPLDDRFQGPLLDVESRQIGDVAELNTFWNRPPMNLGFSGGSTAATEQLLDAWGQPFRYIRSGPGVGATDDYNNLGGTEFPSTSPFQATETWFNFGRFQIVSLGPNGLTFTVPDVGLDEDDITNLGNGAL